MKKPLLTFSILSVLLLTSCTMPTMPWSKDTTNEVISEDVPQDETISNEVSKDQKTPQVDTISLPTDTPKAIADGGVFLPYTPTAVVQAKGNIVLFFYASWCPTCTMIAKDINDHVKNIPSDLTILRVNFDESEKLRKLYEVNTQHTFVMVDNDGKMIRKWVGGSTLKDIVSQVSGEVKDTTPATTKESPKNPF